MSKKRPDGQGKATSINFRTDADLKARIQASADANGRSIAEEMERRLHMSFEIDDGRPLEARVAALEALVLRAS